MAKSVLTSVYLAINGVDLSAYCSKAEFKRSVEDKGTTTFASGGAKERIGGLKDASLDCEFFNDFAAAALDAIMDPLVGTVVSFEIRPTSAAVGTSNPKRTGSILIDSWDAISGGVGDTAEVKCSFPVSGATVRATA